MSKSTAILLASRAAPHHGAGGMEILAWDLACAFARSGVRTVFLTTRIIDRPARFRDAGVDVVAIQGARPGRYSSAWWNGSRAYLRDASPNPFDAIISVSAGAYGILQTTRAEDAPLTILQAHGTSANEVVSKWRTRRVRHVATSLKNMLWMPRDLAAYRRFDEIVAVGTSVHRSLHRVPNRWFTRKGHVHLIQNGIDTERFAVTRQRRRDARLGFGVDDESIVIATVARLHRQKGTGEALRGVAEYARREPRARWLIVGDGPERAELERRSHELGLSDKVTFVGEESRDGVAEALAASDVFLFTTLHNEGLPLNVLEALAAGVGVVVSDHIDLDTELEERVVRVDPFDPEAIALALDVARAWTVGGSRLPSDFTIDACASRYLALVEDKRSAQDTSDWTSDS